MSAARQLSMVLTDAERFGRWVVIGPAERICGQRAVLCHCACGTERPVIYAHLRTGRSRSCGCRAVEDKRVHGQSRAGAETPEYRAWVEMRRRCRSVDGPSAVNYRGRGIRVWPEWDASFEKFLAAVGRRPGPGYSLDRIDNERGYEPGNVRWATAVTQQRNRRGLVLLTLGGETLCAAEWSTRTGIAQATIVARKRRGWSDERALSEPVSR